MPIASSFYPRVFALVVAAVLGYALLLIFVPFLGPMTWAAFLAFLLYPVEPSAAAALPRQCGGRRRADAAGADRHPAAFERPVDRLRRANFRRCCRSCRNPPPALDIKSLSDLQQFPWIARINAWLQSACRNFRGADSILAALRHARGAEARGQLGRRIFPGRLGFAAGHSRSCCFCCSSSLRDGDAHAGPRAPPDPAGRRCARNGCSGNWAA